MSISIPAAAPPTATARRLTLEGPRASFPPFALLIDNALSPSECAALLALAEKSGKWEKALINTGYGQQKLMTEVRNSGRIMVDDFDVAGQLFERVRPFLEKEQIQVIAARSWPSVVGPWIGPGEWKMVRLNERLRFLKYGPGEYFRPHCDGMYVSDNGQRSFLTLHTYLGENREGNVGGSTRFFGGEWDEDVVRDVEPLQGRILIFQHQGLVHSGEEMVKGLKYTMRTDIMYERVEK